MKEAPKEPEPPKELEVDAPAEKGKKVKKVALNFEESTMNVMPSAGGKLLRTLSEGGMAFLLASVRCDTGIKSGRYMFEARVVENLAPSSGGDGQSQPRGLLRLGFSTAGSSLFLGDGPLNCCFDSEGFFVHEKARKKAGRKFVQDTVGVLLNLDSSSPNANTISLFINGERASQPLPLPAELVVKTLFPTITYKNVSLEVNLGPSPRVALPFKCRMLSDASAADVETVKQAAATKPTVVFPVGLPAQGFFDFVDGLAENNSYTELSDRKIIDWATKSGLWKPKGQSGPAVSNDKPEAKFNVQSVDDWSIRRVLKSVAPALQRSYIVPELKNNLLATERTKALAQFPAQDFKRTALVVMGEPNAEFKARVQSLMLAEKTAKAEGEKKKKAQEAERKRLLELKKKKAEEAKKLKEAAQKKKDGVAVEEEPAPAEEKEDEKMETEEPEAAPALTDEEKKLLYRPTTVPDISDNALSKAYGSFTVPSKEEGFDEVTFLWQSEKDCTELLRKWILEKKLTQRAEDLTPGAEFKEQWTKWQKTLAEYKRRQQEYKDPSRRKALQAKKVEAAKKAVAEEKEKLMKAGDEEAANALEAKAVKDAEPKEVDVEELDVLGVADVMDIGSGAPLFENFQYEDWVLLSTRYELHLLMTSFKKDLNDADRPGFTEQHFGYYYNKYFKKNWNLSSFALKEFTDLLDLLKGTVVVESSGFLKSEQAEDTPVEMFVKLTEDHRRERERRVDAGDETAQLKFTRQAPQGAPAKGNGKGGGKPAAAPSRAYGNSPSGNSYGAQKRPYQPTTTTSTYASKAPRTSYGGGSYGGYGGGSGYGRR